MDNICDGSDDCGDLSDEAATVCEGYITYNFENTDKPPFGPFTLDAAYPMNWTRAQPDMEAYGKSPMVDHTNFDIDGSYLHVGGLIPDVPDGASGHLKGRLVSHQFIRSQESDEEFGCKIAFYFYNLAIMPEIGALRLILSIE